MTPRDFEWLASIPCCDCGGSVSYHHWESQIAYVELVFECSACHSMRCYPVITLQPLHTEFADRIGKRRMDAADANNRKSTNNAPDDRELALLIHISGARGEAAGKLFLNPIEWHAFAEKIHGLPDLGDWIDVRTIRKTRHSLMIQKKNRDDWGYLLVHAEHPHYTMIGWCFGHEGKLEQLWADPAGGRPAYFINPHTTQILRPASELRAIHHMSLIPRENLDGVPNPKNNDGQRLAGVPPSVG